VHEALTALRTPSATRVGALAAIALILGVSPFPASAQVLDDIGQRLPAEMPAQTDEVMAPLAPSESPPVAEQGAQTFVLTAVTIRGSTVFRPEDLAPLYESYLARSVGISDLAALADAITQKYRSSGYFLSRAVIPAQSAASGFLVIDIVEGYVAEIRLEGADVRGVRERAEFLVGKRPLRLAELDRTLSLIADMSGVSLTATRIEPDPSDMSVHRLFLSVELDSVQASLYLDNRGTDAVDRLQAYGRVNLNSVLVDGDQLGVGLFTTPRLLEGLIYGEAAYALILNRHGTAVTASGGLTTSDVGANLFGLPTESSIERASLLISHPLVRGRNFSLWANIGLEARNLRGEQSGIMVYNDRLRTLSASLALRHNGGNGTTTLYAEASGGLEGLGASHPDDALLSRSDARPDFLKAELQLSRYQNIGSTFGIYVAASGQLSADPLPASEEFAVGGAQFGRAYDYWAISGDHGVSAQAELRHGKNPGWPLLRFYQLYGFYDVGWAWNRNMAPFREWSLQSAGVGFRLTLPRSVYLTYEAAWPLSQTPYTPIGYSWRNYFSLSVNF
jgi:hemolysin activation/secretion protein